MWLWPATTRSFTSFTLLKWTFSFSHANLRLVLGVCLPGFLALAWTGSEGGQQLRSLFVRLTKWKVHYRWYVLSLFLPFGMFLIGLDVTLFFLPLNHSFRPLADIFKVFLITLPFGPVWEELAWRGLALRRLEARFSMLTSSWLLGLFWATWHIPFWLATTNFGRMTIPVIAVGFATVVAWSVIFAFFLPSQFGKPRCCGPSAHCLRCGRLCLWTHCSSNKRLFDSSVWVAIGMPRGRSGKTTQAPS